MLQAILTFFDVSEKPWVGVPLLDVAETFAKTHHRARDA